MGICDAIFETSRIFVNSKYRKNCKTQSDFKLIVLSINMGCCITKVWCYLHESIFTYMNLFHFRAKITGFIYIVVIFSIFQGEMSL